MRHTTAIRNLAIAIAVAAWGVVATAAPPKPTPAGITVKPDLVIVNSKAERTGFAAGGAHRVRVSVTVRCSAPTTAALTCGAFKILAEYKDGKGGTWRRLGEAGVASLSSGGLTSKIPTETRFFDDTVPAGRTRSYRLKVDSMEQVSEINETNNTATTSYRATGCPGIDLVLTQVSMQRNSGGGTLIRVWVKNRGVEPCVAELSYVIDESEAVPGAPGVMQGLGSRFDGETEAGPLGSLIAAGRPGMDATYTVSIVASGGSCAETNTANNSCRVTIRAGETSRTVRCNVGE